MAKEKLNRTLAGLDEVLSKHLQYEIHMLGFTYGALRQPVEKSTGYALIESFCIHARNLIDFFREDAPRTGTNAVARHFTDDT